MQYFTFDYSVRALKLPFTNIEQLILESFDIPQVLKGLKSKPSTPHEIRDCSLPLTPRQIHQVIVGKNL